MHNLIIQTAFIGDLFLSIPLIRKTREIFPDQPLALLCRKGLGEFFVNQGLVDQVFEVDKKDKESLTLLHQKLKNRGFDHVICPHESFRSAWLTFQIQANKKVGFWRPWNFWAFDQRRKRPMHLPDALRQLSLLTLLDEKFAREFAELEQNKILENPESQVTTDLSWASIPEVSRMDVLKQDSSVPRENKIFLAPGSVWATKRWTEEGFAGVGKALSDEGYQVILIGSSQEHEICERLREQIPDSVNLAGQNSLLESVALLGKGKALITNDSGAMHLAAVAGTPVVAIFGPTTLNLGYRPWLQKSVVVQKELKCRPCGKHGSNRCPLGTHECMKLISAEDVVKAVHELI